MNAWLKQRKIAFRGDTNSSDNIYKNSSIKTNSETYTGMADFRKRHAFFIKCVSIILAVIFLHQQIGWSQEGHPVWAQARPGDVYTESLPINGVQVPYDIAKTKEVVVNGGDEVIVHIQDAHSSLAAQHSISNLLDSLVTNYDLRLIALEGGEGFINTALLKTFPDKEVRNDTAEHLMKEGLMSAGEFFAITEDGPEVSVYGIEDYELYHQNLESFREVAAKRAEKIGNINALLEQLRLIEAKACTEDLNIINRNSVLHREGRMSFTDHWSHLRKVADKKRIDITKRGELVKILESIELEKDIDFARANIERRKLIDALSNEMDKDELEELVLKSLAFKQNKMSQADFHSYIIELAEKYGISSEGYENLIKFTRYVTIYESVDLFQLYREMEEFEDAIREKLYRNDDERKLYDTVRMARLLKQLYSMELTNDEYSYVKTNQNSLTASDCAELIKEGCRKYKVEIIGGYDLGMIFGSTGEAVEFYEKAEARNAAMLNNTVNRMREEGKHVAALITGGYHTEGLTELMKQRKLSYLVVIPKFASEKERPYIAILTNKKNAYKKVLDSNKYQLAVPLFFQRDDVNKLNNLEDLFPELFARVGGEKFFTMVKRSRDARIDWEKIWSVEYSKWYDKKVSTPKGAADMTGAITPEDFEGFISKVEVNNISASKIVITYETSSGIKSTTLNSLGEFDVSTAEEIKLAQEKAQPQAETGIKETLLEKALARLDVLEGKVSDLEKKQMKDIKSEVALQVLAQMRAGAYKNEQRRRQDIRRKLLSQLRKINPSARVSEDMVDEVYDLAKTYGLEGPGTPSISQKADSQDKEEAEKVEEEVEEEKGAGPGGTVSGIGPGAGKPEEEVQVEPAEKVEPAKTEEIAEEAEVAEPKEATRGILSGIRAFAGKVRLVFTSPAYRDFLVFGAKLFTLGETLEGFRKDVVAFSNAIDKEFNADLYSFMSNLGDLGDKEASSKLWDTINKEGFREQLRNYLNKVWVLKKAGMKDEYVLRMHTPSYYKKIFLSKTLTEDTLRKRTESLRGLGLTVKPDLLTWRPETLQNKARLLSAARNNITDTTIRYNTDDVAKRAIDVSVEGIIEDEISPTRVKKLRTLVRKAIAFDPLLAIDVSGYDWGEKYKDGITRKQLKELELTHDDRTRLQMQEEMLEDVREKYLPLIAKENLTKNDRAELAEFFLRFEEGGDLLPHLEAHLSESEITSFRNLASRITRPTREAQVDALFSLINSGYIQGGDILNEVVEERKVSNTKKEVLVQLLDGRAKQYEESLGKFKATFDVVQEYVTTESKDTLNMLGLIGRALRFDEVYTAESRMYRFRGDAYTLQFILPLIARGLMAEAFFLRTDPNAASIGDKKKLEEIYAREIADPELDKKEVSKRFNKEILEPAQIAPGRIDMKRLEIAFVQALYRKAVRDDGLANTAYIAQLLNQNEDWKEAFKGADKALDALFPHMAVYSEVLGRKIGQTGWFRGVKAFWYRLRAAKNKLESKLQAPVFQRHPILVRGTVIAAWAFILLLVPFTSAFGPLAQAKQGGAGDTSGPEGEAVLTQTNVIANAVPANVDSAILSGLLFSEDEAFPWQVDIIPGLTITRSPQEPIQIAQLVGEKDERVIAIGPLAEEKIVVEEAPAAEAKPAVEKAPAAEKESVVAEAPSIKAKPLVAETTKEAEIPDWTLLSGFDIKERALQRSAKWIGMYTPEMKGVTEVKPEGGALRVTGDFGPGKKRQGAILYDFRYGDRVNGYLDMSDGAFGVVVSTPDGFVGPASSPSGIQLGATDSKGRTVYSEWVNAKPAGDGEVVIEFRPAKARGDMDFNASRVQDLQIKFMLNDKTPEEFTYTGDGITIKEVAVVGSYAPEEKAGIEPSAPLPIETAHRRLAPVEVKRPSLREFLEWSGISEYTDPFTYGGDDVLSKNGFIGMAGEKVEEQYAELDKVRADMAKADPELKDLTMTDRRFLFTDLKRGLEVDENGKLADRVWWRYGLCARYRRAYDILHVAAITFPSGVAAYTGTLGYFFAPDDQYIGFLGNALWLVPGRVLIITRGKKTYDDSMLRCLAGEFF